MVSINGPSFCTLELWVFKQIYQTSQHTVEAFGSIVLQFVPIKTHHPNYKFQLTLNNASERAA